MTNTVHPAGFKHFLVSLAIAGYRKVVPAPLRAAFGTVLFGVTPDVPTSLLTIGSGASAAWTFWPAAVITFILCFGGTSAVTLVVGTFTGPDSSTLYFIRDWTNILNYTVIAPAYVGFAALFVSRVRLAWLDLSSLPLLAVPPPKRLPRLPLSLALFLVVLVSTVVTVNFIRECTLPTVYSRPAWYFDRVLPDGSRILGVVGTFYTLLNYSLLVVCCTAAFCMFPYSIVAAEVARGIRSRDLTAPIEFEALSSALSNFTYAYISVKLFTAFLMLNLVTWSWAQPRASVNFFVLKLLLSTIGLVVVSLPRYYVELEWYQLRVRAAQASGTPIPLQSDDLRDRLVGFVAGVLDLFLGFTFVISFWRNA